MIQKTSKDILNFMNKLKPTEKQFVQALVRKNDENATETVKEVYGIDNDDYARLKGHRLITKDNVKEAIQVEKETLKSALEKQGITPVYIAEKVNVLLNAIDDKGNEDYTAIDKGLKHATNIYGIEDPFEKGKVNNTYNFLFTKEVKEEVNQIESIIKSKLTQRNVQEDKESD